MGNVLLKAANRKFSSFFFLLIAKWKEIVKTKLSAKHSLTIKITRNSLFLVNFLASKNFKDATVLNGKIESSTSLVLKNEPFNITSLCVGHYFTKYMHINLNGKKNQIDDLILLPISWGNSSHAIAIDIDNPVVTFSENAAPIDMPSITLCKLSPNNTNRANVDMGLLSSCKDKISSCGNVLFAHVYIKDTHVAPPAIYLTRTEEDLFNLWLCPCDICFISVASPLARWRDGDSSSAPFYITFEPVNIK